MGATSVHPEKVNGKTNTKLDVKDLALNMEKSMDFDGQWNKKKTVFPNGREKKGCED